MFKKKKKAVGRFLLDQTGQGARKPRRGLGNGVGMPPGKRWLL